MLVIPNNIPNRRKSYLSCWIVSTDIRIMGTYQMIHLFDNSEHFLYDCKHTEFLLLFFLAIVFPNQNCNKFHFAQKHLMINIIYRKKSRPHRNYTARYVVYVFFFVYTFCTLWFAAVFRLFVHQHTQLHHDSMQGNSGKYYAHKFYGSKAPYVSVWVYFL